MSKDHGGTRPMFVLGVLDGWVTPGGTRSRTDSLRGPCVGWGGRNAGDRV
jgi:hypothetical protein